MILWKGEKETSIRNLLRTCKQVHFHTRIQLGLCIKFINSSFKLEEEFKIGPIVIDIFQPIRQVIIFRYK